MRSLTPSDLASLLRDQSWSIASESEFGARWVHSATGTTIGVPAAVGEGDFEWHGILQRVAAVAHKPVAEIYQRLHVRFMDITLLRAEGDTSAQSISLDAADRLLSSGRQMVRAAATTARSPRVVIGSNFSGPGDKIASSTRIGYTREGSYIMPLMMPLTPPSVGKDDTVLFDETATREPIERRVTRTLAESLTAIQRRIVEPDRVPSDSVIAELAVAGVSRESVLAVHRSITADGISRMEIRFEWAKAVRASPSLPASVAFSSDVAELLKASAAKMKPLRRGGHEHLTGVVIQVRRGDDLDEFWLQTIRRGRPAEVQVAMPVERRDELLGWIGSGETVVVRGSVEAVRGKRPRIFRPESVFPLSETYLVP